MFGEVEREEYQHPIDLNIPNPTVNTIFRRDRYSDRRRYNIPSVEEVGGIFHYTDE